MDPLFLSTLTMTAISAIYGAFFLNGLGVLDDLFGSGSSSVAAAPDDAETFADTITGTEGADILMSAIENVIFEGLGGDDTIDATVANDSVSGGDGNDSMLLRQGDDTGLGGTGNDTIDGGIGNDSVDGNDGNDSVSGGAGNDVVSGALGDDTVFGSSGADTISGGAGNDLLNGYIGTESVSSNPVTPDGADILDGGEGDDTLIVGSEDIATGGLGADSFIVHEDIVDAPPAVISDYAPGEDILMVQYTPQTDGSGAAIDPVVDIANSADGASSEITVDGTLRATIEGQPDLTEADIVLTPIP